MPTYTYRCTHCGYEFEARQRMTSDPLTECPQCKGKIRRVVNSVGVVFKGKGFYVTDNRSKKAQSPSKKEDGGASSSKSSSDGKSGSDSKSSSGSSSNTTTRSTIDNSSSLS